jgi:hypothetical protein
VAQLYAAKPRGAALRGETAWRSFTRDNRVAAWRGFTRRNRVAQLYDGLRSWLAGGCDAPSQKGAGDALVAGWRGVFSSV